MTHRETKNIITIFFAIPSYGKLLHQFFCVLFFVLSIKNFFLLLDCCRFPPLVHV